MRISFRRVFAISAVILAATTVQLHAQTTPSVQASPPSSPPNRTVAVRLDGVVIDESAVGALFKGIFDAGGATTPNETIIETEWKDHDQMPPGYRYAYYAGRDLNTSREIVWEAKPDKNESEDVGGNDELVAALSLAALDAGDVRDPWKGLYARASDGVARQALGRAIARALDQVSEQQRTIAAADARWISEHIVAGMSRADAYAALRSYGLVAYNRAFNPGVPIDINGAKGCDFTDESAAAWPYHGEPLPKRTGGCAALASNPGAYPPAYITLDSAFSLACGSRVAITIEFDGSDRVKSVDIPDPKWLCM